MGRTVVVAIDERLGQHVVIEYSTLELPFTRRFGWFGRDLKVHIQPHYGPMCEGVLNLELENVDHLMTPHIGCCRICDEIAKRLIFRR